MSDLFVECMNNGTTSASSSSSSGYSDDGLSWSTSSSIPTDTYPKYVPTTTAMPLVDTVETGEEIESFHDQDVNLLTPIPKAQNHADIAQGITIGLAVIGILALAVGFVIHRRIKRNPYRSQEFLLTDSIFRFDGYSQLET